MPTQLLSTKSQITSSPFLRALEHVREQALEQETRAFIYESEQTPRGIFGPPSVSKPSSSEQVRTTLENLDKASDQIVAVQALLRAHPEFLRLLDEAIKAEYKRANRTAILMNVLFTIIGAVLGYLLPLAIQWLSSLQ